MGRVTALAGPLSARHVRDRRRRHANRGADRRHRAPLLTYVLRSDIPTLLTTPVIYSLIVPFVVVDVWVSIYQAVCFRAWRLAPVRRREFFTVDRRKLGYLNALEKANCVYCSYVNGLIAYVREIAARTEQYWCPIRHARAIPVPHSRYHLFFEYGDADRYRCARRDLLR